MHDTEAVEKLTDRLRRVERASACWFIICFLEAFVIVVLLVIGYCGSEAIKAEAVKRGYAEWTPASPGQAPTVFKWKDEP